MYIPHQHIRFLTLSITTPDFKRKKKLKALVHFTLLKTEGKCRFRYLVLKTKSLRHDSNEMDPEGGISKKLGFLLDIMFVMFGGPVFQKTLGIPIGTNCTPLLADLFL